HRAGRRAGGDDLGRRGQRGSSPADGPWLPARQCGQHLRREGKLNMAKHAKKKQTMPRSRARTVAPASRRLSGGHPARRPRAKPRLQYIPWSSVELEDLNPLLQRQFVVGQEIMLARVLLKKGCIVPEHSHHNEQITYILE